VKLDQDPATNGVDSVFVLDRGGVVNAVTIDGGDYAGGHVISATPDPEASSVRFPLTISPTQEGHALGRFFLMLEAELSYATTGPINLHRYG
jgi:hypothetical protein